MGYAFCCVPPARLHITGNSHNAVYMPLQQLQITKLMVQASRTVVDLYEGGTVDSMHNMLSQYVA
jgi:hypothetical protein